MAERKTRIEHYRIVILRDPDARWWQRKWIWSDEEDVAGKWRPRRRGRATELRIARRRALKRFAEHNTQREELVVAAEVERLGREAPSPYPAEILKDVPDA